MKQFDVIIIGAGPAGCSAAIALRDSGLKIALLDKSIFPRDKICGDALSLDVINQFALMDSVLAESFQDLNPKKGSSGVRFSSSKGRTLDIPFVYKGERKEGYVCERRVFDAFLLENALKNADLSYFPDTRIESIEHIIGGIEIKSGQNLFTCKMLLGADGAQSQVSRIFTKNSIDHEHYSAGLRMYCENVKGFHTDGFIELHFIKQTLPGYLWIFPLAENKANVGIGVLSSVVRRKKINLRELFINELRENPIFKERFAETKFLEEPKGFGLPLGSKQRHISGDHFLLLGDAAGLIDPFSGEGIANAIRSGRVAAIHVKKAFDNGQFTSDFLKNYDKEIYARMGAEFAISRKLLMLCKYPFLMESLFRKANKNRVFREFIIDALGSVDVKKRLINPIFWIRLVIG